MPAHVQRAFVEGTAERAVLSEPMSAFRYHGGPSGQVGRWVSETAYESQRVARYELALPHEWNSLSKVSQVELPAGTTIWRGQAAPQISSSGRLYSGGGQQIYIESELQSAWYRLLGRFR